MTISEYEYHVKNKQGRKYSGECRERDFVYILDKIESLYARIEENGCEIRYISNQLDQIHRDLIALKEKIKLIL